MILISHATSTLLGLMKFLCKNKEPKIKGQVASVSKKAKELSDSNNNSKRNILKWLAKQQQDERPTSQSHSHRRGHHRGKPSHNEVDGQLDHQSVKSHSFQADRSGATRVQSGQSIQSCRSCTPSQSEIFSEQNNCYCSSHSRTTTSSQSKILGFFAKTSELPATAGSGNLLHQL